MRALMFATLLTLSLLAGSAEAVPSCHQLFSPRKGLTTLGFAAADARILRHAAKKIDGFLGTLERPHPTVARIDGYLFSFWHSGLHRIGFEFARTRHRLQTLAVFTHEYGHAIFEENFRTTIGGRKMKMGEFLREHAAAEHRLKNDPEYNALTKRRFELMIDEVDHQELARVVARLHARHEELMKHVDERATTEWEKARFNSLAYDELFADVISALHARNPGAVADGFGIPKIAPYKVTDEKGDGVAFFEADTYRPRDFSAKVPSENFRPDFEQFHYTLFDPARATIWKHVRATEPKNYGRLLEAFLQATHEHLELRTKNSGVIDPLALNREFENLFEIHLRRLNSQEE